MDSEEIYKQAILFRRWLHRHPEVSTQEFQTQAFVIDVLKEYKIPYKTYGTGTGRYRITLLFGDSRADARLWT